MRVAPAAALCVVAWICAAGQVRAQTPEVALVVSGREGPVAAEAFHSFAQEPIRTEPTAAVAMTVTIDTDAPLVRVWRRVDGITLERRFDTAQDGYALAVVASELLEVAIRFGDPASVGATVVEVAPPTELAPPEPAAVAETPPEEPALSVDPVETAPGWSATVTPGVGVEGWLFTDGTPWIVQPTLFVELLAGPSSEAWRVGGAIFASALGGWSFENGVLEGSYARHDVGARLSVGGDLGPIATRLLGHVRVGGSAVVGSAAPEGRNDERASATRAGWFVGLGLDLRQPLIAGLEVFLDVSADLLPAPLRFTAGGATVIRESTVRLGGRLGLGWRFP